MRKEGLYLHTVRYPECLPYLFSLFPKDIYIAYAEWDLILSYFLTSEKIIHPLPREEHTKYLPQPNNLKYPTVFF